VNYYALIYHLAPDYMDRRPLFRSEHLGMARAAHERGEMLMGGAFADPADQALLIFHTPSAAIPEAFAQTDPYVMNGLVVKWEVRLWTVVIGAIG
jgi:uncharacterized protein YciI